MRLNRLGAVIGSFLLFLLSFAVIAYWLGTQIVVQSVDLAQKLPAYSRHLFDFLESTFGQWELYYASLPKETVIQIQQVFDSLKTSAMNAASTIGKGILGAVATIPGFLISTIIFLVALFLISLDLPRLRAGFMRMFTVSAREKTQRRVHPA